MRVVAVVVVCCLAAVPVVRALRGPERWHRQVRAQMRPEAAEPTASGYRLLFWRNWAVALIAVVVAWAAVDYAHLGDSELYDATKRTVGVMDGTSDPVTSARIEAAIEGAVQADLAIEKVDSDSTERDAPTFYEVTEYRQSSDDTGAARLAVCVEVTSIAQGNQSGSSRDYTSVSSEPCER